MGELTSTKHEKIKLPSTKPITCKQFLHLIYIAQFCLSVLTPLKLQEEQASNLAQLITIRW